MIIITAGHTGEGSGARGVTLYEEYKLDEGRETIWLRDRVAEILSSQWGIVALLDRNNEKLGILVNRINNAANVNDFCLDLHLNASKESRANGTEVIIADDASDYEVKMGVNLLNATASALGTNVRCVKTEKQVPHQRLAILHLNCHSVVLEVCFCTNASDAARYMKNRERLAQSIARVLAKNIVYAQ